MVDGGDESIGDGLDGVVDVGMGVEDDFSSSG